MTSIDLQLAKKVERISQEIKLIEERELLTASTISVEVQQMQNEVEEKRKELDALNLYHLTILHKIERREQRPRLYSMISLHLDRKVQMLKDALVSSLSNAALLETEIQAVLDRLQEHPPHLCWSKKSPESVQSMASTENQSPLGEAKAKLVFARKKMVEEIVHGMPAQCEANRIRSEMECLAASTHSCDSIAKQLEMAVEVYRKALILMRKAMMNMMAKQSSQNRAIGFVKKVYPLVLEAEQLLGLIKMTIQPDAMRRFQKLAGSILNLHLDKFPKLIRDIARAGSSRGLPVIEYEEEELALKDAKYMVCRIFETTVQNSIRLAEWQDCIEQQKINSVELRHGLCERLESSTTPSIALVVLES